MIIVLIVSAVIIVSLLSFVGVLFLGFNETLLQKLLMALVGFASGSLIGGAFFHLLPGALEAGQSAWQYVAVGIVFFFIMEKFLYWRHCHDGKCPVHIFAYLNLIGDGMHNLIDGIIIAASFLASYSLGFATTLAVIFHEVPQEIGDFGVLVYGGFGKRRALTYNFMSALSAVAGALVTYFLASYIQGVVQFLVPFAAGGFIYIAATDLMPELHKRTRLRDSLFQLVAIILGLVLMWSLVLLE